ncbi:MAG: putative Ig domain-containing protein [Candidatus Accumulibacter sp.]|jgi:hypothetical protein|nr:putative Ig domain-containing protein [Accumulibacter sp.]
MGGSSSKTTVGYWYNMDILFGLCRGPIDAFLEFRGGDRTAWKGFLQGSGTISINQPNLWGGEKVEGGIVSNVDVMFGEAGQAKNAYLLSRFGEDQGTYRGRVCVAFKGGHYGAMNPYPKPASFKVRRVKNGWRDGVCWYPEKAEIFLGSRISAADRDWRWLAVANSDTTDRSSPSFDDSAWAIGRPPFADKPWNYPGEFGFATTPATVVPHARKVWMRTTIPFAEVPKSMRFQAFVDNDCRLYVNGRFVIEVGGQYGAYYDQEIPTDAFVVGENSIAVEGWDRHSGTGNWFWFDWRFNITLTDLAGMNPAHILYDSLTSPDMMGEPVAWVDDASFRAAADVLYAEGFGLCTQFDGTTESVEDFQTRICNVIGGAVSRDRCTGLWCLDLFREVSDLDALPILTDDDILDWSEEPGVLDDAVNQVIVEWFDPLLKEERSTAPVQALGMIQSFGGVISDSVSYPEIPTESLTLRVAARDLRNKATPLSRFELKTNRVPWAWRAGISFRLQCPRRGIADLVCRVGEIDVGTLRQGAISLTAVQDVFSLPAAVYVEPPAAPDISPDTPGVSPHQRLIEAPYIAIASTLSAAELDYLATGSGFVLAMGSQPESGLNYVLATAAAGEEFARHDTGDWTPHCVVAHAAAELDTTIGYVAQHGLTDVALPVAALWDDEIIRIDTVSPGALSVGRGCADTTPRPHAAGSVILALGAEAATDGREYTEGDLVSARLLTVTSGDQLPLDDAPTQSCAIAGRWFRPYPPGALTLNGEAYPAQISGNLLIGFAHRHRTQQGDLLVDTTEDSIGPEPGTTYALAFYDDDTDALRHSASGIAGTKLKTTGAIAPKHSASGIAGTSYTLAAADMSDNNRLDLWSERDGLDSFQRHVIRFRQELLIVADVPAAVNLESYSATLTASGLLAPIIWSIAAGALPAGLHLGTGTMNETTISGVPNAANGYYAATVRAEDANGIARTARIEIPVGTFSLLMHYEGTDGGTVFTEQTGKTVTRGGSPVTMTDVAAVGASSVRFPGDASYLRVPYSADFDLSTSDFTIEFWLYLRSTSGSNLYGTIIEKRNASASHDWTIINGGESSIGLQGRVGAGASEAAWFNMGGASGPVILDAWEHYRVARRGMELRAWRNGQLVNQATMAYNLLNRNLTVQSGCSRLGYTDSRLNANLDELSVVKGAALSWESGFIPPRTASDYPQPAAALAVNGSLPAGTIDTAYISSADITIHGSDSPFSVSVSSGALPGGWTAAVIGSNVVVSGAGVAAGDYTFTLEVSDSAHRAVYLPLTVCVS